MSPEILIIHNTNDPRCGPEQVGMFMAEAEARGRTNIIREEVGGGHNARYQTPEEAGTMLEVEDRYLSEQLRL